MRWLVGKFEPETIFLWLYGDAGAGKSSICQTFAVKCAQEQRLLASFFFWRNDPRRSSHTSLMATLIHQAVAAIPDLRTLVAAAIDRDPSIFQKHLERQIVSLLVEPINELVSTPELDQSSLPALILIDGLDECASTAGQCEILEAFSKALSRCRLGLKILIASRSEVDIMAAFNSNPLSHLSTRIALNASFCPDEDMRKFLHSTFEAIKSTHPLKAYIPPSWPSSDVIPTLVERSSGQFIFVSTIGKYVSDRDQKPTEQLEIIMALRPAPTDTNMPYMELNALYTHVLSRVPPHKIEKALDILSFILVVRPRLLEKQFLPSIADRLLGRYSKTTDRTPHYDALLSLLCLQPGDIVFYLANLSSLVEVDNNNSHGNLPNIRISHASLGDFLLDRHRSHKFYCNPQQFFGKVLCICLKDSNRTSDGVCH